MILGKNEPNLTLNCHPDVFAIRVPFMLDLEFNAKFQKTAPQSVDGADCEGQSFCSHFRNFAIIITLFPFQTSQPSRKKRRVVDPSPEDISLLNALQQLFC